MKKNWKNILLLGVASAIPFSMAFADSTPAPAAAPAKEKAEERIAQASIPLPINRINQHIADMRAFVAEKAQNNSDVLMEYDNLSKMLKNAYLADSKMNEGDIHIVLEAVGFAAEGHNGQLRENPEKTPYIIHPIRVTEHLMTIANVHERDILVAALLHDTVEDTKITFADIQKSFGTTAEGYVRELTDNMSLPQEERMKLQIETAPKKSLAAAQIKLADKYDNLKSLQSNPPATWDQKKIDEYFLSAKKVTSSLPAANVPLKKAVDDVISQYKPVVVEQKQI